MPSLGQGKGSTKTGPFRQDQQGNIATSLFQSSTTLKATQQTGTGSPTITYTAPMAFVSYSFNTPTSGTWSGTELTVNNSTMDKQGEQVTNATTFVFKSVQYSNVTSPPATWNGSIDLYVAEEI